MRPENLFADYFLRRATTAQERRDLAQEQAAEYRHAAERREAYAAAEERYAYNESDRARIAEIRQHAMALRDLAGQYANYSE